MGQYYRVILGDDTGRKRDVFSPSCVMLDGKHVGDGLKLTEHCFMDSPFAWGISLQIYGHYKRVIWVGDYAVGLTEGHADGPENRDGGYPYYVRVRHNVPRDVEIPSYEDAWSEDRVSNCKELSVTYSYQDYIHWASCYLVNRDKKEYVDLEKYIQRSAYQVGTGFVVINPLVLLTAVGNTLGGGDYYCRDMDMVGSWAWNLIALLHAVPPEGYTEISPTFREDMEDE